MALKTQMKEYKIDNKDLWYSEKFINITIKNTDKLTTEEIHNRPIVTDNGFGKVVGILLEADEEYLYGYIYNFNEVFERKDIQLSLAIPRECVE